jgi:hypothetical protein
MNNKQIFILSVFLLVIIAVIIEVYPSGAEMQAVTTNYAYYDDIDRGDGIHTLKIYNSLNPTWADKQPSLKNIINWKQITYDGNISVEFTDFNNTDLYLKLTINDALLNTKIPIKVDGVQKYSLNYNLAMKTQLQNPIHFNYATLNKKILDLNNFSIGATSASFQINDTGGTAIKLTSDAKRNDPAGDSDTGNFGYRASDGFLFRMAMNFSNPLPAGAEILRANISLYVYDLSAKTGDFSFVGKIGNSSSMPFHTKTHESFEGWVIGPTSIYGGRNITALMNTTSMVAGQWFNISLSQDGIDYLETIAGQDFKIIYLHSLDNIAGSFAGTAEETIGVHTGAGFEMPPILYIEYTSNYQPTFNLLQLNSTNAGRNLTADNLNVIFKGIDTDAGDVLMYNLTIFKNNLTNFTLYNIPYTNGTLKVEAINSNNLSIGSTFKAMVTLSDNTTTTHQNTSELLILNAIPALKTGYPQFNSTLGKNYTNEDLIISFVILDDDVKDRTLRYNLTAYKNNLSANINLTNKYYTNGTFSTFTINNLNTTKRETWKIGLTITDNSTTIYQNTSELLILNSPPNFTTIANLEYYKTYYNNLSMSTIFADNDQDSLNYSYGNYTPVIGTITIYNSKNITTFYSASLGEMMINLSAMDSEGINSSSNWFNLTYKNEPADTGSPGGGGNPLRMINETLEGIFEGQLGFEAMNCANYNDVTKQVYVNFLNKATLRNIVDLFLTIIKWAFYTATCTNVGSIFS